VLTKLRYEIGRRRPRSYPYRRELLRLFHDFVVASHGTALDPPEFFALAERHLGLDGSTKAGSRYLNDLWELFEPDYGDRLPDFYRGTEHVRTMRFVDYASDPALIETNYTAPYRWAADRLGALHVLEIGAGIPHGLITLLGERPGAVASFATNDIDALYTRFCLWFCAQHGLPAEWLPVEAGTAATSLPRDRFDFVFAKDVFEHLHSPEAVLDEIVAAATPDAVLALDLEDKGPRGGEHVSPHLEPLAARLETAGWRREAKFGVVSLFTR
jgi:SAM-dependent methyltransferase